MWATPPFHPTGKVVLPHPSWFHYCQWHPLLFSQLIEFSPPFEGFFPFLMSCMLSFSASIPLFTFFFPVMIS
ncbi:hypothetical protein VIGAN_06048700 [Vigna angularis var. angularis]|uniref:Uncharacterized protein n=1 Tax=Vigna angularis var. angularis TaxID=157739 RepID=A0A0S3S9N7_PHAAN|nr:hypothetical protein VIGAN_06048700 [Vigna angularis var. angularis]